MPAPTITTRDYSTVISASQGIHRCITFNPDADTSVSLFTATIEVDPNNDLEGKTLVAKGRSYIFTAAAPNEDNEIQVGATNNDTAINIANALFGSSVFPVYEYGIEAIGGTVFMQSINSGAYYHAELVTTADDLTVTIISFAVDNYFPDNYKMIVEISVDDRETKTTQLLPNATQDFVTRFYDDSLYLDTNNFLKDFVFTPDPTVAVAAVIERVESVSALVNIRAYEIWDGFNGSDTGEILDIADGVVLNARGTVYNGQNSLEEYHPSIAATQLQKFLMEYPSTTIPYCDNIPNSVYIYIDDSMLNTASWVINTVGTNGGTPFGFISAADIDAGTYTEEGVYRFDIKSFVDTLAPAVVDSVTISILQDAQGLGIELTEEITVTYDRDSSEECCDKNTFVFLNRFGVYETIVTSGDFKEDMDLAERMGTPCTNCTQENDFGDTKIMNKSFEIKTTCFKNIPNDSSYITWFKSFLYSSKVFKYDEDADEYVPVKINTKTRTIKRTTNTLRIRFQYEMYPSVRAARV